MVRPTADDLMHDASALLVEMDYLGCEKVAGSALMLARRERDWSLYARAVMPLQEARRQLRMTATDGQIQLGTNDGYEPLDNGCVVFTAPHSPADAQAEADRSYQAGGPLEVLYAEASKDAGRWTLRSFAGPEVSCEVDAPPSALRDAPLHPDRDHGTGVTPRHWFVSASEALGDAALASVDEPMGTVERVDQLERWIEACWTHELLHQALADAAHALAKAPATG